MTEYQEMLDKIESNKAVVGIIGLGYVGLPLALASSMKKYKTYGFDLNLEKIRMLKAGVSYIEGLDIDNLNSSIKADFFLPTNDMSKLCEVDIVLICVPTPLNDKRKPNMSFVYKAIDSIRKYCKNNCLIVIESTVYPNATNEIKRKYFENRAVFLAFSPERIDPANKEYNVLNTPKIVGGINRLSAELSKRFYEKVIESKIIMVSDSKTAEMCKILENTYRLVNIALILEFKEVCEKLNIDIWEVIDAASTKPYGFHPFYPGPGVGGHCIPIDPIYLTWKMKKEGVSLPLIDISSKIVENTPRMIVKKVKKEIEKIDDPKVLVVGITYKKDVSDLRESPSLKLFELLVKDKIKVSYYDPYVDKFVYKNKTYFSKSMEDVKRYDLTVIAVDHSNIDFNLIYDESKKVLDLKNVRKKI